MASSSLVLRVLLLGVIQACLPYLRQQSLTHPALDPKACEDAMHAGAACTQCLAKFKFCRGHFTYEPFTVVLSEAFATILLGSIATFISGSGAMQQLVDFRAMRLVAPIGFIYGFGDLLELVAVKHASPTTLIVANQLRLPLCAVLRSVILGRGQTSAQWATLLIITLLCTQHVLMELSGGSAFTTGGASWSLDSLMALPPIFGKSVISVIGAIHAEYFLQSKGTKGNSLWAAQVHFKTATVLSAIVVGYIQGRRGGRIMADVWQADLFTMVPQGVRMGDPRTPFFGGWTSTTWILVSGLVTNNFVTGDQLRRLSSVAKYVALAFGLVLSYILQLWSGSKAFEPVQVMCCAAIAAAAVAYVSLPSAPAPQAQKKSD